MKTITRINKVGVNKLNRTPTLAKTAFMVTFLMALQIFLAGCSLTTVDEDGAMTTRQDAKIPAGLSPEIYDIQLRYFHQDRLGITESIEDIQATISRYNTKSGGAYFRWDRYETRKFELKKDEPPIENGDELDLISSDDRVQWIPFNEVQGFTYYLAKSINDEKGQLDNMPELNFLPRVEKSFFYYIHMIDFHMWDIYATLAEELKKPGDARRISEEKHVIKIKSPLKLFQNFTMDGGQIYLELLGAGILQNKKTRLFYSQQNQRFKADIVAPLAGGLALKMPMKGTNRFPGIFELDENNRVVRARFNEYATTKLNAPLFITINGKIKREFKLKRL